MNERVVLAAFGSFGDLNPILGIAKELKNRGATPVIGTTQRWQKHVENAGLEFRRVRSGWPDSGGPSQLATHLMTHGLQSDIRATFSDLLAAAEDADALVTMSLVVPGPMVAEKTNLPWISVVLEPMYFFSAHEPVLLPFGIPVSWLKQMAKPLSEPFRRLREELKLPPGKDPFFEDYLSADAVLALFSPLLASPQPDWPVQSVITGFVTYDQFASKKRMPERLQRFLDAGPPPIVFTMSSDVWVSPLSDFARESILAAKLLGRRAIVIGLDLVETQTADVLILNHVPYSEVFSHAAAVVHHGGIGTSAIALAAGKPMLVVPGGRSDLMSYAQPDNAARLARLGVARVLQRANFNAAAIATELATLLADPVYAKDANEVSEIVRREDGARVACDVIQRVIAKRARSRRGKSLSSNGQSSTPSSGELTRATYLHLLKKTLTRYPLEPSERLMFVSLRDVAPSLTNQIVQWGIASSSGKRDAATFNPVKRAMGMEWPEDGETMIGLYRLNNLEQCIISVIKQNVPGDLMETGVWRGGASIFMRAVLQAYGDRNRKVWLADSFQGLPKPDAETYPVDMGSDFWIFPELAVPLEKVKANFARYGLLDDQVRFLPGWFRDTLPSAPVDQLAVLRLDGDMYESTIVALRSLYDKVSAGGFVIVDDYFCFDMCRKAVDDFRAAENIVEPLCQIDWTGVYWQVSTPASDRL